MKYIRLCIAACSWWLVSCGSPSYVCENNETANGPDKDTSPDLSVESQTQAAKKAAKTKDSSQNDEKEPVSSTTPWLTTKKNKIYLDNGKIFRGRGANIFDTRSCNACTWTPPNVKEVKRRIDLLVDDWKANFIRLNLESYPSAQGRYHFGGVLEDASYLKDIVEILTYIGSKTGVYVVVSLWTEPTVNDKGWPTPKTIPVWEKLTTELAHMPHVLFGICNEPKGNDSGSQDKNVWDIMNKIVEAIRAAEKKAGSPNHIIAVQGTRNWSRYLGYYVENPITAGNGKNIVYETHSYLRPSEFSKNWLDPAKKIPVIIGEFAPYDKSWGKMTEEDTIQLMDDAEKRDIPWLAWSFHMRCAPNLIQDNSGGGCGIGMELVPTDWGNIVRDRLNKPWKTQ